MPKSCVISKSSNRAAGGQFVKHMYNFAIDYNLGNTVCVSGETVIATPGQSASAVVFSILFREKE